MRLCHHRSPPPTLLGRDSLWVQLPPATRQRLLGLLSHLIERQLPRPAGGTETDEEGTDEPARSDV